MSQKRVELWEAANGRWYFHVVNRNGRVTGPSQGYRHKRSAVARARREQPGVALVEREAPQ